MFSGIVERRAVVEACESVAGGTRLSLRLLELLDGLECGASIAINGVCLTLAARRDGIGSFDVVPETLARTNLGRLRPGDFVNVERSLRADARIDGHIVQGHVEGLATVTSVSAAGAERLLRVRVPAELQRYLSPKGSITLDGVSLTIAELKNPLPDGRGSEELSVRECEVTVALIPTTLARTTLDERRVGDLVNIETDILARLVVGRVDTLLAATAGRAVTAAGGIPPTAHCTAAGASGRAP